MSKASEWAEKEEKRLRAISSGDRPSFTSPSGLVHGPSRPQIAWVVETGEMTLGDGKRLSPPEAIRFARWILDTFGEGDTRV